MPADPHKGVPNARFARKVRQVTQRDVVVEREPPHARRHIQVGRDSPSHLPIAVDEVEIDHEEWSVGSVATETGPDAVALESPHAVGHGYATEEGAVEATVDDLTRATSIATKRRDVDIDADAERHPQEHGVHGDVPAIARALRSVLRVRRPRETHYTHACQENDSNRIHDGSLSSIRASALRQVSTN